MNAVIVALLAALCAVESMPVKDVETGISIDNVGHKIQKRFVNLSLASGGFSSSSFSKIRAKRSLEEECEKLRLCRLHARSNRNFIAAFELYFVNKENARLWDHHAHSLSECSQRYSCYRVAFHTTHLMTACVLDEGPGSPTSPKQQHRFFVKKRLSQLRRGLVECALGHRYIPIL